MLNPTVGPKANAGQFRKSRAVLFVAPLLVALPLAIGVFSYLTPKAPNGVQGRAVSLSWYLSSGQWQADARTFVAAMQFMMQPDSVSPVWTFPPGTQPIAVSHSGSNPPSLMHVKDRIIWVTNGVPPQRMDSSHI